MKLDSIKMIIVIFTINSQNLKIVDSVMYKVYKHVIKDLIPNKCI